MKLKESIYSFGVCFLTLISCSKEIKDDTDQGGLFESKHFVQTYLIPHGIRITNPLESYIGIVFEGDKVENPERYIYADKETFEKMCQEYGDIGYNGKVLPGSNVALISPVANIEVISKQEFQSIKAGESLNDLFIFCGYSAYPYIQSNYQLNTDIELPEYLDSNTLHWDKGYLPILKDLGEVTKEEMSLLSPGLILYLKEKPKSGNYIFQITLK